MSGMDTQESDDAMWIRFSENWWEKTHNPLHVWRVVAICLNAKPSLPIPDWCTPYLAEAAFNLTWLNGGHDFRGDRTRQVTPEQAHALVSQALGLSRQGKKNAFIQVKEHARDDNHRISAERSRYDAAAAIAEDRNITLERARRRLAENKRMAKDG